MYTKMEKWTDIRMRVGNKKEKKSQILEETGMHWKTLEKILTHPEPPGYQMNQARQKPILGPYLSRIHEILKSDRDPAIPQKQTHTAQRIFERIKEEGYQGAYTQVKEAVREWKQVNRDVFIPLQHPHGEAQVDFGFALVKLAGELKKVAFFVMALPHSDAIFVMTSERECTETFWEGHVRAFNFFGGVARRITYDNSRIAVSKIIGAHKRKLTYGFLQLQSHYLFEEHFCCVRRPNEKGVVEGTVKYARLNFMVPVPQVQNLEELNVILETSCRENMKRKLRGRSGTKEELLKEDQAAFLPLPPSPFDACRKADVRVSSLSLGRFDCNDYSVPVEYAHHLLVAKGYIDRVMFCYQEKVIAEHKRIWEKEQVSLKPEHYLPLLETRPGALDHGKPFVEWKLPDCFPVLRRRMENEFEGGEGIREYIGVLQLLRKRSVPELIRAVEKTLRVGGCTRDVVAQYLYGDEGKGLEKFRLDGREHLRYVRVDSPDLSAYQVMMKGDAL